MIRILKIGVLFLFSLYSAPGHCQGKDTLRPIVVEGVKSATDTLLMVRLDEVQVKGKWRNRRKHYRRTRKYVRTVRNIQIVYPYAQLGSVRIQEINARLIHFHRKKERRKFIRHEYKSLMREYRAPLMKLKISQGKLLMKLIDRETGNTSYEHLKELKGSFNAFFWQSVALMFGSNLKSHYDPEGKDWMVEEILQRMELGELPSPRRIQ
jgi:hypothetical protein